MSLKTKYKSARAMPVEAVLTRSKLAQLKQNKPHKKVKLYPENELLKPKNRKRKISEKKVDCTEFQPDKVKRKVEFKKVMLNPKHNDKVIADMTKCNKRKLNVPKKDYPQASPTVSLPSDNEESVFELITQFDGTQEMDDDDFLEILTCPSPVWWEDPPPGYTEDPISVEYMIKKEKVNIDNDNIPKSVTQYLSVYKDIKNNVEYVNKSKNLEFLLDNIKTKKDKDINVCDNIRNKEFSTINELENKNINEIKECTINIDNPESKIEIKPDVSNNDIQNIELNDSSENTFIVRNTSSPICIELKSDETDQEETMNVSVDDNSLFFLENIEIPIVNSS